MKEIILNVINSNSGIKEVQLAMRVMSYMDPTRFTNEEFCIELARLISSGDIEVVHYNLPNTTTKLNKSIYFPKGTEILTSN